MFYICSRRIDKRRVLDRAELTCSVYHQFAFKRVRTLVDRIRQRIVDRWHRAVAGDKLIGDGCVKRTALECRLDAFAHSPSD